MNSDRVGTGRPGGESKEKDGRHRIDYRIPAAELRVIDEDGSQIGILSKAKAVEFARQKGMNVVELNPNASPPVVKIMDYGKFLFETKKQKSIQKKKQKQVKLKEVKLRPVTDTADYEVKLRNLVGFLEDGDKVKVTVVFRGREMTHHELGFKLLTRVRDDVGENGKIDSFPTKLEGRQLVMMISPKKKSS